MAGVGGNSRQLTQAGQVATWTFQVTAQEAGEQVQFLVTWPETATLAAYRAADATYRVSYYGLAEAFEFTLDQSQPPRDVVDKVSWAASPVLDLSAGVHLLTVELSLSPESAAEGKHVLADAIKVVTLAGRTDYVWQPNHTLSGIREFDSDGQQTSFTRLYYDPFGRWIGSNVETADAPEQITRFVYDGGRALLAFAGSADSGPRWPGRFGGSRPRWPAAASRAAGHSSGSARNRSCPVTS